MSLYEIICKLEDCWVSITGTPIACDIEGQHLSDIGNNGGFMNPITGNVYDFPRTISIRIIPSVNMAARKTETVIKTRTWFEASSFPWQPWVATKVEHIDHGPLICSDGQNIYTHPTNVEAVRYMIGTAYARR